MQGDSLYRENTLSNFWQLIEPVEDEVWSQAIVQALQELDLPFKTHNEIHQWSLGEASYGNQRWSLSFPKQIYYICKPAIPQWVSKILRRIYCSVNQGQPCECEYWPIDSRLVDYYWLVLKNVMQILGINELDMIHLWPENKKNAFVLTHDIETVEGQSYVEELSNIDAEFGFHSAFYFIPHRYDLDLGLIQSLKDKGFEVGIHGYNHDGKLFCHFLCTQSKIEKINQVCEELGARSFRAPLTLRDPERMQGLNITSDLSFFDTDPFEPLPGGTMSIFPYHMGKLIELPYTLVQDYTLFEILQETTPDIWLKKISFLEQHCGLILLDSHPDYLKIPKNMKVYRQFLAYMQEKSSLLWNALPVEVEEWWRCREAGNLAIEDKHATISHIRLNPETQLISLLL